MAWVKTNNKKLYEVKDYKGNVVDTIEVVQWKTNSPFTFTLNIKHFFVNFYQEVTDETKNVIDYIVEQLKKLEKDDGTGIGKIQIKYKPHNNEVRNPSYPNMYDITFEVPSNYYGIWTSNIVTSLPNNSFGCSDSVYIFKNITETKWYSFFFINSCYYSIKNNINSNNPYRNTTYFNLINSTLIAQAENFIQQVFLVSTFFITPKNPPPAFIFFSCLKEQSIIDLNLDLKTYRDGIAPYYAKYMIQCLKFPVFFRHFFYLSYKTGSKEELFPSKEVAETFLNKSGNIQSGLGGTQFFYVANTPFYPLNFYRGNTTGLYEESAFIPFVPVENKDGKEYVDEINGTLDIAADIFNFYGASCSYFGGSLNYKITKDNCSNAVCFSHLLRNKNTYFNSYYVYIYKKSNIFLSTINDLRKVISLNFYYGNLKNNKGNNLIVCGKNIQSSIDGNIYSRYKNITRQWNNNTDDPNNATYDDAKAKKEWEDNSNIQKTLRKQTFINPVTGLEEELSQIIAVRDFYTTNGTLIKRESKGGWVTNDAFIKETDRCWIDENTYLFGKVRLAGAVHITNSTIIALDGQVCVMGVYSISEKFYGVKIANSQIYSRKNTLLTISYNCNLVSTKIDIGLDMIMHIAFEEFAPACINKKYVEGVDYNFFVTKYENIDNYKFLRPLAFFIKASDFSMNSCYCKFSLISKIKYKDRDISTIYADNNSMWSA